MIGRSELKRLELPSLEDSLEAAVAKAKSGKQETVEFKPKGNLILSKTVDLISTNVMMPTGIAGSNSTKRLTNVGQMEMV